MMHCTELTREEIAARHAIGLDTDGVQPIGPDWLLVDGDALDPTTRFVLARVDGDWHEVSATEDDCLRAELARHWDILCRGYGKSAAATVDHGGVRYWRRTRNRLWRWYADTGREFCELLPRRDEHGRLVLLAKGD